MTGHYPCPLLPESEVKMELLVATSSVMGIDRRKVVQM